jgi:hypothetical protein
MNRSAWYSKLIYMHIEINKNIPSVTTDVVYIKLEQSNQINYELSTWRRAT